MSLSQVREQLQHCVTKTIMTDCVAVAAFISMCTHIHTYTHRYSSSTWQHTSAIILGSSCGHPYTLSYHPRSYAMLRHLLRKPPLQLNHSWRSSRQAHHFQQACETMTRFTIPDILAKFPEFSQPLHFGQIPRIFETPTFWPQSPNFRNPYILATIPEYSQPQHFGQIPRIFETPTFWPQSLNFRNPYIFSAQILYLFQPKA